MKIPELTISDCIQAIDTEILIGSVSSANPKFASKRFVFNVYHGHYEVYKGAKRIDASQSLEGMLELYNSLDLNLDTTKESVV